MYGYETDSALPWGGSEQTMLLLAREQEWAEAYHAEHPDCPLGTLYLDFIRRELMSMLAEL